MFRFLLITPPGFARALSVPLLVLLLLISSCNRKAAPPEARYPYDELPSPGAQEFVFDYVSGNVLGQVKQHYWGTTVRSGYPETVQPYLRTVPDAFYAELERVLEQAVQLKPDLGQSELRALRYQTVTLEEAEDVTQRLVATYIIFQVVSDVPYATEWAMLLVVDLDAMKILYWETNPNESEARNLYPSWPARTLYGAGASRLFQADRIVLPPGMTYDALTRLDPGGLERLYYVSVGINDQPALYSDDRGKLYRIEVADGKRNLVPSGEYPMPAE